MKRDEATEAQVNAARPTVSTWLAADAGSGKTRVLTDRVARLLLRGTDPQRILCLTYTKAAAGEMQNRLFSRLGGWAMLGDGELAEKLNELGESENLQPATLASARRLFARAIETPGGLKIQTIHSFCASILRRFPLEAGVSPQFKEIEDADRKLLIAEVLDSMAEGRDHAALAGLNRLVGSGSQVDAAREILSHQDVLRVPQTYPQICEGFGVSAELTEEHLFFRIHRQGDFELLRRVLSCCDPNHKIDRSMIRTLEPMLTKGSLVPSDLPVFTKLLVKETGSAKIDAVPPSKTGRAALSADDQIAINDLAQRVEDARSDYLALNAAQRTLALQTFAEALIRHYSSAKEERGWLDFDDLILKTKSLLSDPKVSQWVLWRLDGGISHILVDEAQDTSPIQWDIIGSLTEQLGSGQGAKAEQTTVFAVGDRKQSIYSFQGADPESFDRMREHFSQKEALDGRSLQEARLDFSFRSAPAILEVVDRIIQPPITEGFEDEGHHRAFHSGFPGRVDLWPAIERPDAVAPPDWTDPTGYQEPNDENDLLAQRIAHEVQRIRDEAWIPKMKDGEVSWKKAGLGDVLILTRRRKELYDAIIRQCKRKNIEVAGADRLTIASELAVKDILAVLRFLALPEDDMSLAQALKSPLLGWSEQDLFQLAQPREGAFLWAAFREKRDRYPETDRILSDLLNAAEFLRPYDLIERLLTWHDGRRRLVGRLGAEVEEAVDALLEQALQHEQTQAPSLTGFLGFLDEDDIEIKRRSDGSADALRIMTIHGAKGLEAPIVILPETFWSSPTGGDLLHVDGDQVIASVAKPQNTERHEGLKAAEKARADAERDRLWYVALTRAESWLIIGGAIGPKSDRKSSWHRKAQLALESLPTVAIEDGPWTTLRYEPEEWGLGQDDAATLDAVADTPLPSSLTQAVKSPDRPARTLSPSDLGGEKIIAGGTGQDGEVAREEGQTLHHLLEVLPQISTGERLSFAKALYPNHPEVVDTALRLLELPHLSKLFKSGQTEVTVTGSIDGFTEPFIGTIDLLVPEQDHVHIIDYKSNLEIPKAPQDTPEAILRQMGAYRALLEPLYPGREIQTSVLWTRTGVLMTLPHEVVSSALLRATSA